MNPSVIVIGAGPGGLASAMLLASTGVKVKLLERMPIVGGRTSAIQTDGFKFDLGPTFFLYPRVLDEIFAAAGASLRQEVELVRLDPQYRIIFGGGGELNATPDIARMEQQIGAIAPEDASGFRRFLEENRTKLDRMLPCLENPFLGWQDMLNLRLLKTLPILRPHQSVDTYLSRFFRDSRIRLAFSFQSKYLGMSPFRCPSLFSILSFLEYEYGVFHPIGGCAAVTAAMARVAERLGVEICLDQPVEEILFEGRRAVGVRTREGVHRADALIVNADFARAMSRLVPDRLRHRWTDRKIAQKKFSCSTFMMYLGVEGRFDLPHHNIHIADDYARNLDEIENQHVLSGDPSFYVQNASVTDPTLAPRGNEHALRAGAGHPSACECRLGPRARPLPCANVETDRQGGVRGCRKAHPLRARDHAGRLGSNNMRFTKARRSTSRTVSTRCCIYGRTTASRISTAFISSAAARIRAAAFR